jgi:hypothetical protein
VVRLRGEVLRAEAEARRLRDAEAAAAEEARATREESSMKDFQNQLLMEQVLLYCCLGTQSAPHEDVYYSASSSRARTWRRVCIYSHAADFDVLLPQGPVSASHEGWCPLFHII